MCCRAGLCSVMRVKEKRREKQGKRERKREEREDYIKNYLEKMEKGSNHLYKFSCHRNYFDIAFYDVKKW